MLGGLFIFMSLLFITCIILLHTLITTCHYLLFMPYLLSVIYLLLVSIYAFLDQYLLTCYMLPPVLIEHLYCFMPLLAFIAFTLFAALYYVIYDCVSPWLLLR